MCDKVSTGPLRRVQHVGIARHARRHLAGIIRRARWRGGRCTKFRKYKFTGGLQAADTYIPGFNPPVTRYRLGNTFNGMSLVTGLLTVPVVLQCTRARSHDVWRGGSSEQG
eukprot:scaffold75966_cov74-Phaeocystis_antarctica.AAC.9